ncbi:MAG: glycosyltransferase family 39 protein [Anaerolineae bacterium]|nr:glycosyltransferase family 39 protein [Anaerolineae bacterium]
MTASRTRFTLKHTPALSLALILLLALALRLAYVLPLAVDESLYGGDYSWYAREGRMLIRTGWTYGPLPTGPVFLLVAGYAEELGSRPADLPAYMLQLMLAGKRVFPDPVGDGVPIVRVLHAILGTLTAWMAYRIGRAAWDAPTGLLAGFLLAINPQFIVEAGNPGSESVAIFLLAWALAIWMEGRQAAGWRVLVPAGILLALAALTRSVFLAIPALLIAHLWLLHGWRRALRGGALLLLAWLLTISPWTLYNLVTWDRLTLTGEGLLGMLYVGAVGWQDPEDVDAGLGELVSDAAVESQQEAFAAGLAATILRDPAGYALTRLRELGGAILQPHNTNAFPGESIKTLASRWLRDNRTLPGLLALTRAEQFWIKLLLYVAHYAGLLLGGAGLLLNLRRWRALLPLYGLFAYILGIHLFLSAIPRYLFPLALPGWLFASAALVALAGRVPRAATAPHHYPAATNRQ